MDGARPTTGSGGETPSAMPQRNPGERAPFDAFSLPIDVDPPADITAEVLLLADFALKLSVGPVSQAWAPMVRRSAEALLSTGRHRDETALAALSARLLSLLPRMEPTEPTGSTDAASGAADAQPTIAGAQREQILHEISRLAGVLPEWPAPARDLEEEARRRETRIVRELLTMVDGFKRDQRARLEEQTRLEELAAMTASEIADEFEAPLERASELALVLGDYRRQCEARAPDVGNVVSLRRALAELSFKNGEFDGCDAEQKERQRVLRLERRRALSIVNVLLAELGELEWLDQLEPLSIGERIERLTQWYEASHLEATPLGAITAEPSRADTRLDAGALDAGGLDAGWHEAGIERTS